MKKWKKICLYILAGFLCFVGIVFWGLSRIADDMCGNKIIEEDLSPDQKNKITIFVRDCGATTAFSTHASIISAQSSHPNEGGNLFVSDTDHGKAPSGPGGGPKVEVMWKDNNSIIIKHHKNNRIIKAESKLRNINVFYEKY
jgi:hypothetical protein